MRSSWRNASCVSLSHPPNPEDLQPLTDQERLAIMPGLNDHFGALLSAYHRGMIVAQDDEEREVLGEIASLVGPPTRPRQQGA